MNATLTNCDIHENIASNGGGVYGGSLHGCAVSNNAASVSGGGINSATAVKCVIADDECALISSVCP